MSTPKKQRYDVVANKASEEDDHEERPLSLNPDDIKQDNSAGDRTAATPSIFTPLLSPQYREGEVFKIFVDDLKAHFRASTFRTARYGEDDKEFITHCIDCCEKRDELDIYQVLAFESTLVKPVDIRSAWTHRMRLVKALACSITQITFMAIVLYQLVHNALYHKDKTWCKNTDYHTSAWFMNLLACFVSLNFSFTVFTRIKVSLGLYRYILLLGYNVNWINHFWLYLGFFINALVLIGAVWASFFIIFYAETAMSMIYAMVSIFYITTLDDKLIDGGDYNRLKNIVDHELKKFDDGNARLTAKDKKMVEEVRFVEKDKEWIYNKKRLLFYVKCRSCIRCCSAGDKAFTFLFGIPFLIVKYATMTAAIFMPFYLAACF